MLEVTGTKPTAAELIKNLREETGLNRTSFARHLGIPIRTIEDWEAGRRKPPEYVPRLISYQLRYEKLMKELGRDIY